MAKCLVECPHCGKQANVKEELIGKKTRCPECQRIFTIERASQDTCNDVENDNQLEANCPVCNSVIFLAENLVGTEIVCPYCRENITVDSAKVPEKACPFCGEMIKKEADFCKFCHKKVGTIDRVFFTVSTYIKKFGIVISYFIICVCIALLTKKITPVVYEIVCNVKNPDVTWLTQFVNGLFSLTVLFLLYPFILSKQNNQPQISTTAKIVIFVIFQAAVIIAPLDFHVFIFTVLSIFLIFNQQILQYCQQYAPSFYNILKLTLEKNRENNDLSFEVECPGCQALLEVQQDWKGQELECPECHEVFTIN